VVSILVFGARSERVSPSLDVLSSTGKRTVGWMAMYDIFISQNIDSGSDIGFSGVGGVKWAGPLW